MSQMGLGCFKTSARAEHVVTKAWFEALDSIDQIGERPVRIIPGPGGVAGSSQHRALTAASDTLTAEDRRNLFIAQRRAD
jgi:hypothetical protein